MTRVINRELAHNYIIYDLVVRTLKVDLERTAELKTATLINKMYNEAFTIAKARLKDITLQMKREGLRILDIKKKDEIFTIYLVSQYGLTNEFMYANPALRNHTMDEIERIIKAQ